MSSGPQFLAVSRREAIQAAAAVRSTRQKAAFVLSSVDANLVGLAGSASTGADGVLLRLDLEGNANVITQGSNLFSRCVISPDQRWVLSATRKRKDGGSVLGVSAVPVEGGEATFQELDTSDVSDILDPVPIALVP